MPACDGCLGQRTCWVCLGYGVLEPERGRVRPCHRCFGTGRCDRCQALALGDLGNPPVLTVTDPEVVA